MNKLKILGIGMTFVLLVSLISFAGIATAAGPGEQQWDYITEPEAILSGNKVNTDVGLIDFEFNGVQGYVLEFGYSTDGRIARSANGGQSWSTKSAWRTAAEATYGLSTTAAIPVIAVAVAPDDKLSIALADNRTVWRSNNEGDTWTTLPAITFGAATDIITDVAVGPADSNAVFGRVYAVTVADAAAGTFAGGTVLTLGASGTWTNAATGIVGLRDYVTLAFSPNYAGDKTIVALGASGTSLDLQELKIGTTAVAPLATQAVLAGTTLDVGSANEIMVNRVTAGTTTYATKSGADIALPSDYSPTDASTDVVFVGVSSKGASGGVFRVKPADATTSANLFNATANIKSVAYSGTSTAGTLYAGVKATGTTGATPSGDVRWTANPFAATPDWTASSKKPGTGANAPGGSDVKVRLDSSFAFNKTVYAMTTTDAAVGADGDAFSVSTDGGVSFDQWSWIDAPQTNIGSILDMKITSDESTVFYLTNDKGGSNTAVITTPIDPTGSLHLWKAPSAVTSSGTWSQVWTSQKSAAANNTALVTISPDWKTAQAIYIVDTTDATIAAPIYFSKNGGATWGTRSAPLAGRVDSILATDADTVYITVVVGTTGKTYKSTNAAFFWADGVSSTNSSNSIIAAPNGELIIGRNGGIYTSTNQGGSWSSNSLGLSSAVSYWPAVTANYATDKTYFVAGNDGSVWRRGTADPAWVNISPAAPAAQARPEIAFGNGVLYVLTTNGVLRNLDYMNQTPANVSAAWEKANALAATVFYAATTLVPATADPPAVGTVDLSYQGPLANMFVYGSDQMMVAGPVSNTMSYRDNLADHSPDLAGPADGSEISIDPNTGLGQPVTFTWGTLGTGMGVPTSFQIELTEVGGTTTLSAAFGVGDLATPSISSATIFATTPFRANKTYEWRLRVRDTLSGDMVRSPWTTKRTLKVGSGTQVQQTEAGPVLIGPQGGQSTNLRPGFSWAPVPGATEYEFILATDALLTKTVAGTPATLTTTAFQPDADLTANTTYFWAVRATKPTLGIQKISTFTTAAPTVAVTTAPPPVIQPPTTITVTAPPPNVTVVPPAQGGAISQGLIWVVIGIGAILIIAVLVLIVRTRRPV